MSEEEEKIKDSALANSQRLKSKFVRKINELKASRHLLEDASRHSRVTEEDCANLQSELNCLASLKADFESNVEDFGSRFGSKYPQDGAQVDKMCDECIQAYLNIKVNVGKLLLRVRNQLDGGKEEESRGDFKEQRKKPDAESLESIDEDESDETGDDITNEEGEEEDEKDLKPLDYLKTCLGFLVIVIVFYSLLGLVIYLVRENQEQNNKGIY